MSKPKKNTKSSLVVVPPPPTAEQPGAVALSEQGTRRKKSQVTPREHPDARDSRGKASRSEVRKTTARIAAPRANGNPPERARQTRSHRSGKKRT